MSTQLKVIAISGLMLLTINSANALTWYDDFNDRVGKLQNVWAGLNDYQKTAVVAGGLVIGVAAAMAGPYMIEMAAQRVALAELQQVVSLNHSETKLLASLVRNPGLRREIVTVTSKGARELLIRGNRVVAFSMYV